MMASSPSSWAKGRDLEHLLLTFADVPQDEIAEEEHAVAPEHRAILPDSGGVEPLPHRAQRLVLRGLDAEQQGDKPGALHFAQHVRAAGDLEPRIDDVFLADPALEDQVADPLHPIHIPGEEVVHKCHDRGGDGGQLLNNGLRRPAGPGALLAPGVPAERAESAVERTPARAGHQLDLYAEIEAFEEHRIGLPAQTAQRHNIVANRAELSRGVMDDPAILAEADAGDALQGNAPAQFFNNFLPIAANDHGRVRAERQPAFRVFRGVPAAQDGQYPGRHGANLVSHERGIAVPVDREADQVRLRPKKIPCVARLPCVSPQGPGSRQMAR